MQEVYVVMVTNGEHSDQEELPVLVCPSPAAADQFVAACQDWARRNGVWRRSQDGCQAGPEECRRLSAECPGRPANRSSWTIDYTGIDWSVRPVPQGVSGLPGARPGLREEALSRLAICQQLLADRFPRDASAPLNLEEACEIAAELARARSALREAMGWNWLEEGAESTIPQFVWEQCESAGGLSPRKRVTAREAATADAPTANRNARDC